MLTKDIVPITRFNRGGASSVFETLSSGPKVVVKNNIPVCVMISPESYDEMTRCLKEARLFLDARNGQNGLTTLSAIIEKLGITQEDLDNGEDPEIE